MGSTNKRRKSAAGSSAPLLFPQFTFPLWCRNENVWALLIFSLAAYLILVNLGYVTLWHDEAPLAVTGRNILLTGGYNGWDGRNLFLTADDALSVNSALQLVAYPPWQALPSALGIALFGSNELGVRFFHSVLGLLALVIFWLLLRLDFRPQPRLRVLAFALFALSAQVLLFLRLGRYVADAIFFALLLFYAYRLYIGEHGKWWHLALAAAAALLGFFNHFAIGAAFALSLLAWHLLYYARSTSRRQWLEITVAALLTAALALYYLIAAGILFGDERLEQGLGTVIHEGMIRSKIYLIYYNYREMLVFGWLPFWVVLWFIYMAAQYVKKNTRKNHRSKGKRKKNNAPLQEQAVIRWTVLLALFLFLSGIVALRGVATHTFADSRYLAPGLAFTALLSAACLEWLWRQPWGGGRLALPLLLLLLSSNILFYPFVKHLLLPQESVRLTLPSLIGEIHRPYPTYIDDITAYLREHAQPDDTIYIEPWQDFAVLQFYLSDLLRFCCKIDKTKTTIPEETIRALGVPLYRGDAEPDWFVVVGDNNKRGLDEARYEQVYVSNQAQYPFYRPELEFHSFRPLPSEGQVQIYRRRGS